MLEEIYNGMELLDQIFPGWQEYIDLTELDMDSPTWCVLGQIGAHIRVGNYYAMIAKLGLNDFETAATHGFSAYNRSYDYNDLTRAWTRVLSN